MRKNKVNKYINSLRGIDGKLVIVTGANSGLGYCISRFALLKGARLVMACRNQSRAEIAKEKLIQETNNSNIEIAIYDQADFNSVENFAKVIKDKFSNFYALVLNAGILLPKERVDDLHVSLAYKTNFLGALLLMDRLQPLIENSENERRIIVQGSLASFKWKYKDKDKFIYGEMGGWRDYSLSKLCISNLYVYYRNLNQNPHVKYLLCEPGVAATNIFSSFPKWFKPIAIWWIKVFTNTAEEGALSACKLLSDLAANGDYYRPRHLFAAEGLPKKGYFKEKYIYPEIIEDGFDIIKSYGK